MRCDVIAEGVVAAVKEVGLQVPLVVRLEGTNVEKGKGIINNSGLDVIAANDLKDGAEKYEEEVPITIDQCMRSNRDNLLEAIEEYVDASVYQMADKLGSWSLESKDDDTWADYYIFHQRSLAHLIYAYFLLRGALSKRAEINVNIKIWSGIRQFRTYFFMQFWQW